MEMQHKLSKARSLSKKESNTIFLSGPPFMREWIERYENEGLRESYIRAIRHDFQAEAEKSRRTNGKDSDSLSIKYF